MTNPLLANTLERIANDPEDFYTGDLAKDILADLHDAGRSDICGCLNKNINKILLI